MPTNRTKRVRKRAKAPLLDFVRILLMDGLGACHIAMLERKPGSGKIQAFRIQKTPGAARAAWKIHRVEILKQWKAEGRRGRPWAEKLFKDE